MNGIAALALKEAAVASGVGSGLLAPSAVDGFAVGTLLSGVCLLVALGPRHRRRRARQSPVTQSSRDRVPANAAATSAVSDCSAAVMSGPSAIESAEVGVLTAAGERDEGVQALDSKSNGHRSKHRLSGPGASRRPESRGTAPRHAARTHRIGRMASKLPLDPVPVRD
jgi:hypothetical protein